MQKNLLKEIKAIAACLILITAIFTAGCTEDSASTSDDQEISDNQAADESTDTDQTISYTDYALFAPLDSKTTYLIDSDGNTVHTWVSDCRPGNSVYFLENGQLLRTGSAKNSNFDAGGRGGVIQKLDWDSNIIWEYTYSTEEHLSHHDAAILPNGNVLLIAWELKSSSEAIEAGKNPSKLKTETMWPDSVVEIMPTGSDSGEIVWEWHIWDHLVQDYDSSKSNYGVVSEHPELININYGLSNSEDWTHTNAINYNTDLDQILLSIHNFSEIWIIDHSTTTEEAATHSGGKSGHGGDLLYRWGNPQTYDSGTSDDQCLFGQHDAEWITENNPGYGNIIIFNNGQGRPDGEYSTIEEITPPINEDGTYDIITGNYGPESPSWEYIADTPENFYASFISGQQRLSNGNTLICNGPAGHLFEVTDSGETVWEYTAESSVFRAERYRSDYQGFNGIDSLD